MKVRVMGWFEPDDDEIDEEDETGLTPDAYESYSDQFEMLMDLTFTRVE